MKNIKDDIQPVVTARRGTQYQAVDPITREPTGPLRRNIKQAQADDEAEFQRNSRSSGSTKRR